MGRFWRSGLVFGTVLLAICIVVGLLAGSNLFADDKAGADAPPTVVLAGSGCDKAAVVSAALQKQGFLSSEFVVGEDQIDWSQPESIEHGSTAFGSAARTAVEWTYWLGLDEAASKKALAFYVEKSGQTQEQILEPANWVPAQLLVESSWAGNTAFVDGKVKPAGTRHSAKGDVVWLYIYPTECNQTPPPPPEEVPTMAGRAGCKNPQLVLPVPTHPSPPPVTPGTPPTPSPECEGPNCGPTTTTVKCQNQTGPYCGTPDSGPEYLPPRQPPSNPNVDVSPQPPPPNNPPPGAPPQQSGPGPVVIDPPDQPATPPTSSPPVGDPGGF